MRGAMPLAASPREPGTVIAVVCDQASGWLQGMEEKAGTLWSLIWPSDSKMMIGRRPPSQTVWSLELSVNLSGFVGSPNSRER